MPLLLFGKTLAHIYFKQLDQPMKNKLSLSTDRKSAAEGDYIEVSWACDACPDSLYLAYDSGSERYSMAVADSGTTRILIRKSDGKAIFTLNALIGNKKVSQSVEVKIKKAKTVRPAKVSGISRMKMWKEKLQAGWYVFRAQLKYWWLSRKKWQKALWIALLALWLGMLISSLTSKPKVSVPEVQTQTASITAFTERPNLFA